MPRVRTALADHAPLIWRSATLLMAAIYGGLVLGACRNTDPSPTLSPIVTLAPCPTCAACPTVEPSPTPTTIPAPPLWPTPVGDESVLPAPLYYISKQDELAEIQCRHFVRIERDGRTRTPIPRCLFADVNGFDVSPTDGSIVFASRGALWLIDDIEGNMTKLVDGLPDPELVEGLFEVKDPAWSPDGAQIAYADGGIRILDVTTEARMDIIENQCVFILEDVGMRPCFYGHWFDNPRWAPDGNALLFHEQTSEYPVQQIFKFSDTVSHTVPGTLGVTGNNITWNQDGTALLFDYWWPANVAPITTTEPALVLVSRDDFSVQVLWPHGDRADPIYASGANNPWQARYPFESPDGRILFFQAEPCSTGSCYDYALVEGILTDDGFDVHVLHRDALLGRFALWHESGEFVAFATTSGDREYISVMRVSTGDVFLLAEEPRSWLSVVWGN